MTTINETDYDKRQQAILCLEIAKENERKRKLVPLRLSDKDNTIIMIPPHLSARQREKLKQKKLQELSQNRISELTELSDIQALY
ncbi:MAG: hypothetical protein E6772_07795 [Dysgonomonas sp.]|nr:hypothetical protein [Dysgonomonas sp.]